MAYINLFYYHIVFFLYYMSSFNVPSDDQGIQPEHFSVVFQW